MQKKLTTNDVAFCPDGDTVEDAYWLLLDGDAALQLYEAHLTSDSWSPSGYCWDCYAHVPGADGRWVEVGGGQWRDYSDADQLLPEFPGDFDRSVELTEKEFRSVLDDAAVASILLKVTFG